MSPKMMKEIQAKRSLFAKIKKLKNCMYILLLFLKRDATPGQMLVTAQRSVKNYCHEC